MKLDKVLEGACPLSRPDKSIYETIYRMLDMVTPLITDCGVLCRKACCRSEEAQELGIYLLPGEHTMFSGQEDWLVWEEHETEAYEFPPSWTGAAYFVRCTKSCPRQQRPLQCRTYPLAPHILPNGVLALIKETLPLPYHCPILENSMEIRQDFIENLFQAWTILNQYPLIHDLIWMDSREREKASGIEIIAPGSLLGIKFQEEYSPDNDAEPVFGKNNPAPRNRGIILTSGDLNKLGPVARLPETGPLTMEQLLNGIFAGDCRQALNRMPPESIDLVFADPPYNIGKDFGKGTLSLSPLEYSNWLESWIKLLPNLLKKTGAVYICCDWRYSGTVQEVLTRHLKILNRITWKREKGRGAQKNWKNNMEDIWFAVRDAKQYHFFLDKVKIKKGVIAPYRDRRGDPKDWFHDPQTQEKYRFTCPSNIWMDLTVPFWSMKENTPHPTQKPEKLVERVLLAHTNPGDIVLDPFIGSGTTAAAAKKMGRQFIGFDMNETYVLLAMKRLGLINSGKPGELVNIPGHSQDES
ncbi:MAG: DNA-methyltransferase [Bacillota bacterium]